MKNRHGISCAFFTSFQLASCVRADLQIHNAQDKQVNEGAVSIAIN